MDQDFDCGRAGSGARRFRHAGRALRAASSACAFACALALALAGTLGLVAPGAADAAVPFPGDSAAAAAGTCTPSGGAPGVSANVAVPIGGAIGLGVGGSAVAEFVAALERSSRPPPPGPVFCDAPRPSSREPASLVSSSIERAAGNPVDVVTGNKYERHLDVALPHAQSSSLSPEGLADAFGLPRDDTLNLLFARHYNSRSDFALSLGRGWSHSFETRLARLVRAGRVELQIVQADGRRLVFRRTGLDARRGAGGDRAGARDAATGGAARAPRRSYGTGSIDDGLVDEAFGASARTPFVWRWPDGRRVRFDADGRLESIESADGDLVRLHRDESGRLREASDNAGRSIGFEYRGTRLDALRLPDGQRIRYDYDVHRQLVAVRYPDGRTRRYEYADPRAFHRLTAMVEPDGRRSEYRYADDGRVVYARAVGRGEAQALRFAYAVPARAALHGTTTVRAGDRVTRYRWIGARRDREAALVASEGDGCERCPPVGLRVRTARNGRTTTIGAMHVRRDAHGRIVERRIDGADGRTGWFERYAYAPGSPWPAPVRIVRPSVVAGRTVQVRIGYNERAQVASIDLHGFAPDGDTVQPIVASLRLEYAADDPGAARGPARGRLSAIVRRAPDGRVQRTSFTHDAQRRLVAIRAAASIAHEIERDALGRAVSERLPDGTTRTREFDAAWRVARTARRATSIAFGYDAAGRPRSVEWSGGERWTIALAARHVEIASNHGWRERIALRTPPARRGGTGAPTAAGGATGSPVRSGLPIAMASAAPGRLVVVDARSRRTERRYDDLGRLVETRSAHEGPRRYRYDAFGRLARIEFADGGADAREYDAAGRLVRRIQTAAGDRVETRFRYDGAQLFGIEHPEHRAIVRHDDEGRVVETVEHREGASLHERFEYDERGRLSAQVLADGSRLVHRYDAQGRPLALALVPAGSAAQTTLVRRVAGDGPAHTVLEWGNGVRFERRDDAAGRPLSLRWHAGPGSAPAGAAAGVALAFRTLRWNPTGVPTSIAHENGEDRYAYDRFGRLIVRERHASPDDPALAANATHVEYFALDALGERIGARRRDGSDARSADARRDAGGRPTRWGAFALRYGAQRRVAEVHGVSMRARYRYDAFGRRIGKSVERGPGASSGVALRGFAYRDRKLVAETDGRGRLLRQYLHWNGRPVAVLSHGAGSTAIAWLHADHLGTPIAASDEAGRIVWRGDADAYGRVADEHGAFAQPLRLPGQYFDAETGLHDNLLRTYDPDSGAYLEPDPLGLEAGLDAYGYADGNPLVATDPLGLLLFAFDGTGNGETGRNGEDLSNVRKFFDASDDPDKWYMAGVGRDDYPSGIEATSLDWAEARTARERVDWMVNTLDGFLDDAWIGRVAPVDVVGFSRGAAMARDFVNRVSTLVDADHFRSRGICVDLRFLGLWDTVAQFGWLGLANERWQLSIPSAVRATFHAVAVNEHRTLFPLESALGSPAWVVERGFVGSHADVGGGNAEGDLSDVALAWMTRMAQSLGVPVRAPAGRDAIVSDPRVHDRDYFAKTDRSVYRRDAGGAVVQRSSQRAAIVPGLDWNESLAFLVPFGARQRDANGAPSLVGRVDMQAYGAWLASAYGIDVRSRFAAAAASAADQSAGSPTLR